MRARLCKITCSAVQCSSPPLPEFRGCGQAAPDEMATNSADPRRGGSTGGRLHQIHGSSVLPPRSIGSGETFRLKDAKHRLLICINARN